MSQQPQNLTGSLVIPTGRGAAACSFAGTDRTPLTATIYSASELPKVYVDHWRELALATTSSPNPFLSYVYLRAVADSRPFVYAAVLRRGESVLGYLPFQFATHLHKRLKVAEPPGADLAGYFGLTGGSDCVLNSDTLLTACGLNYMWVEQLDQSQRVHGLTAEAVRTGLIVDLQGGAKQYWAEARRLDPKFVTDTERRERQLVMACGPLKFTFSTADPDILDHLIEQKRAQYRRTGVTDALRTSWRRRVLHRLAERRDPDCTGVLSTLYAGSSWVASHFGLLGGRTLYFCFPVYNPEFRRYSPGRLLVKAIIDAADESGIVAIDRCAGDTQAKRDFANVEHKFYRGAWRRPCLATLSYQVGCSIYWRISGLRQVIRNRGLQGTE